jgi:predicted extracellular nuclease
LNAALGAGTYDYISTGFIGTDAIKQALIYRPASVEPVGSHQLLTSAVDSRYDDSRNRPALAQAFLEQASGSTFTVVVNHLKSKGSACGPGDDDPQQGNCNQTRTLAAQALVDWVATDPTGSGSPNYLIMGDLNAYDKEDPIDAILEGADDTPGTSDDWTDLVHLYQGEHAYSYVFDGQLGYLDHGLASGEMLASITGTTIWHVNADEPDILDYDTTFKQPPQDALYEPNAYRSSDHDPVIVGLALADQVAPELTVSVEPSELWPANHKYVDVEVTLSVSDAVDPNPTVVFISVFSDEPDNGPGDGNTINDIVVVDETHFRLRAERAAGGDGRTYTITYLATDASGNTTLASATVTVPMSRGKGR